MKERKPRVGLEVGIQVQLLHNQRHYQGVILDISEGGIKFQKAGFEPDVKFKVGEELVFETDVDFYGIKGRGEVKWFSKMDERAGICFLELDEKSQHLLNAFLDIVA